MTNINKTQTVVVAFIVVVSLLLVAILVVAPDLYDEQLRPIGLSGNPTARAVFLAVIAVLIAVLTVATLRRWRWAFWLILAAFAAGALRVPVFGLQLVGVIPLEVPIWYAALQAAIGVVEVMIAFVMWRGYRRAGPWGAA